MRSYAFCRTARGSSAIAALVRQPHQESSVAEEDNTAAFDARHFVLTPHGCAVVATALLAVLLGVTILVRQRRSPSTLRFAFVSIPVALWLAGVGLDSMSATPRQAVWWARVAEVGVAFIGPALYAFTVSVLGLAERRQTASQGLWIVGALFAGTSVTSNEIVEGVYRYPWGFYARYGSLGTLFVVVSAFSLLAAIAEVAYAWFKVPPSTRPRIVAWLIVRSDQLFVCAR